MKIELRAVDPNVRYEKILEREVFEVIKKDFMLPLVRAWRGPNTNEKLSELQKAIKRGDVEYRDGLFRGYFTKEVAHEIRNLGGVFNRASKTYSLEESLLPQSIKTTILKTADANLASSNRMFNVLTNITRDLKTQSFENIFLKIITNTVKNTRDTFKSIPKERANPAIFFDFTEEQAKEIAKIYSTNMNLYIKNFTEEQTLLLRRMVEQNIAEGKLARNLEPLLAERFGVSKNKAKFLARQETSLCTVAQKVTIYKEQGAKIGRWKSVLDSKTRPQHKHLHNQEFDIYNPPIDVTTGERLLPGAPFNCRCNFTVVVDL
jgi:SPP1 gp7 family putative phage head morphogenesis protein